MPTLADVHIAAQLSRAESAERRGYVRALRTVARRMRKEARAAEHSASKWLNRGLVAHSMLVVACVRESDALEETARYCERRAREVERDSD
jgi:hypothetical protein